MYLFQQPFKFALFFCAESAQKSAFFAEKADLSE